MSEQMYDIVARSVLELCEGSAVKVLLSLLGMYDGLNFSCAAEAIFLNDKQFDEVVCDHKGKYYDLDGSEEYPFRPAFDAHDQKQPVSVVRELYLAGVIERMEPRFRNTLIKYVISKGPQP